jgi:hypothetical protein
MPSSRLRLANGPPCGSSKKASGLLALLSVRVLGVGLRSQENSTQNVRLAEGQYKVYQQTNAGGVGPFAPGVYNFSESWTLWRAPDGSLAVEGKREYQSPSDETHSDLFTVRLTSQFRVISLREFRKLRWSPDSGPLNCEFQPARLACTSGAVDPKKNIRLDLPVQDAYGFLWPISAFSLSHITRFAGRTPASVIPVQMVTIEEHSADDPVFASVLDGHLAYLGHEDITVADRKWPADKFELTVPLHSPFLIWTSPAGLLLDFSEEDNHGQPKEQGMKLVRYRQWLNY